MSCGTLVNLAADVAWHAYAFYSQAQLFIVRLDSIFGAVGQHKGYVSIGEGC
jgi:hypothetical protein